ncbi:hypothetical protein [Microbacterium sp. GCS4]|uniref:hypothetical protein n=1 Tax=Microbacterium sp. GCS4 TaxID=1692239 RepID=UPI000681C153|nr:hypothetical protein [Microbacterium sp. GCS4]KNY06194.1 hypothetical protein AKH00_10375 [Microbacterium sp. GCS4]
MELDIAQVRKDTTELMAGVEGWSGDYLTDDVLDGAEDAEDVIEEMATEDDLQVSALVYYGNRPVWIRDTSRPGYVGKLLIYNGSVNRPNDPCGTRFRRAIWFYHSPRGTAFRNCGAYTGFQFINA